MKKISAEEACAMMGWTAFPEVRFPEGFLDKLKGKTLEELSAL